MGNCYKVNSNCLRYVVPFKYADSFDDAYRQIEGQKEDILKKNKESGIKEPSGEKRSLWIRKENSLDSVESDLYGYIKNEFAFAGSNDSLGDEKIGCEWIYWRSAESAAKDGKKIADLVYFPMGISKSDEIIPDGMNIAISNVGIYLFRNGFGLLWYEVEFMNNELTSDILKLFQNTFRELNRGDKAHFWKKTSSEPNFGIVLKEEKGHKTYITPFLIGHWINNEMLGYVKKVYLAERKCAYNSLLKNSLQACSGLKCEIVNNIEALDTVEIVPDKAILFTYASFDKDDKNCEYDEIAYHIANGYKDSYHYNDEIAKNMRHPFKDAVWYATQEGCAYLVWTDSDNQEVFNVVIPGKIRSDYFVLFIKSIFQSYSLLVYAEKIQQEISITKGKHLIDNLDERITELFEEINLFLTKSMATSVSHIHHQSEFYIYLKEQLRIHDDVKSVMSGLNALDAIQREQRQRDESRREAEAWQEEQRRDKEAQIERAEREDREKKSDGKIQAIMGLFAMLGISSALVDCFDFISKFSSGEKWSELSTGIQCIEIIFIAIIGCISVTAIVFAIKAIVGAFKD